MEGNGSAASRAELNALGELFDEKLKPVRDTLGRIEPKLNQLWDVHIADVAIAENEEKQRVEDESRWTIISSKSNALYPAIAVLSLLLSALAAGRVI